LVNGEKVSCQGKYYYLQCGQPNVLIVSCIIVNGQPVWFVAVRVRAARFLQVPVEGTELSRHDKDV
jgi:hypothetical protein